MKRMIAIVMIILLIGSACGCGRGNDIRTPVNFYYCTDPVDYNTVNGVISPEVREGDGYDKDLKALLDLYLQGPVTDGLRSPFPSGVFVESITEENAIISICVNRSFSQLTGYHLTLACASLSMTIFDLHECETVRITVSDALLDGSEYIEMQRHDLLLLDEYTTQKEN